jgi:hypothetical protein
MTPHSEFSESQGKDLRRTIPLSIGLEPRGELQRRSVFESHRVSASMRGAKWEPKWPTFWVM